MNEIASWLLLLMPFSFAAKTIAIGWATWIQTTQRPVRRLGWYIFWFFVFLTLTSASLIGMFGRLAWRFHEADGLGVWLWWMVPVELFSWLCAIFGVLMVREERRLP